MVDYCGLLLCALRRKLGACLAPMPKMELGAGLPTLNGVIGFGARCKAGVPAEH